MKKILKNSAIIMISGAIISKVFGFIRDMMLARTYGAGNIMDSYVIATIIPNIILGCIGIAISNTIISLFSKEVKETNEENAKKILDATNLIMLILSLISLIIIFLFSENIINVLASGFDSKTINIASRLVKITSFSVIFISFNYVLNGFLNYKNKFFLTSLSGTFSSILIVIFSILGIDNIYYYASAWIIGSIIQFVIVLIYSRKNKYIFKVSLNSAKKYFKPVLYLAFPLMISYSIKQINVIVDKSIASNLFSGAISSLNYANEVITAVTAILITSIVTVQYSKMSQAKSDRKLIEIGNNTIDFMTLIIIPISVLIILFSKPIIYLLFYGGNFDIAALANTSKVLVFYAIGLSFIAYRDVLIRICLIKNNSRIPMISNMIAVIANVILNIILSRIFGIVGLALATTISILISVIFLLIFIKIKISTKILSKDNIKNILKVLFAILILSIIFIIFFKYFNINLCLNKIYTIIICLILCILMIAMYIIFLKILRIDLIKKIIYIFNN